MKFIRFLLFPFAILYDLITSIRNVLFDKNILKSTKFSVPVIAVGNLNVGGTGKTPQIEYLIRLLKHTHKVAVLSRGYKRKTKGFQVLNNTHSAEDVGDEPLQFFKKFDDITVAVDADRTNGIHNLLKRKNSPNVILLDDAFQHRKVTASFYVLLTKYNDLYTDDFLLPTGNLRESRRGAKRANVIIVTKCPEDLSEKRQKEIVGKMNLKTNQQVFFSSIAYADFIKGREILSFSELKNQEIILVTGIANPNPLIEFLTKQKVIFTHLKYQDHYNFTEKDINDIKIKAENKLILTTEKDFVRLNNKLDLLYYLPIETRFLANSAEFDKVIKTHIS